MPSIDHGGAILSLAYTSTCQSCLHPRVQNIVATICTTIPFTPSPFPSLNHIHVFEWYVVMCGSSIGHTRTCERD